MNCMCFKKVGQHKKYQGYIFQCISKQYSRFSRFVFDCLTSQWTVATARKTSLHQKNSHSEGADSNNRDEVAPWCATCPSMSYFLALERCKISLGDEWGNPERENLITFCFVLVVLLAALSDIQWCLLAASSEVEKQQLLLQLSFLQS